MADGCTTSTELMPPTLTIDASANAAAANVRSVVHQGGKTTATTLSPGPARNVRAVTQTQLTSSNATGQSQCGHRSDSICRARSIRSKTLMRQG